MAQQETVFTQAQPDAVLSTIPSNAQEAREIAKAIADGWTLRVEVAGDEQESDNAA